MPRTTPSRIATRLSRRHSPTSSSAGSSTQTKRRKALVPLCGPDGIALPGILTDSDPALKDLTKSKAQAKVNQTIREAILEITGGPPDVRVQKLCRKDHTMGPLQPLVGHNNYKEIGRYYSICSIGTTCTFKTYGERLSEEVLMLHDTLTPLLFKREELRPIVMSKEAQKREGLRVTITSSPMFGDAVKKYYTQLSRVPDVGPLTPPSTNSRARPRPFPCPSPLNPTRISPSAQSDDGGNSTVDFIDLSEDHEDVLFWAIVWVEDNLKYKSVLFSPKVNEARRFTLSSLKLEMGKIDVEQSERLETYDPAAEIWRQVPWHMEVGPLNYDGQVFLFRYAGVTELEGFDRVKPMARRLPGSKGKHH